MRASCMHRTVCMPLTAAGMKSLEDNIKDRYSINTVRRRLKVRRSWGGCLSVEHE